MSACRADRRAWGALTGPTVLGLAVLCFAGTANAQAPQRIYPPGFDPDTMELAEPANSPRAAKVQAEELKAPSAESVGVLDSRSGGFANTLWAGTPAPLVRALVPLLPGAGSSLVVRDLERRLLLTSATAPEGADGLKPSLVELRAERLMAMGDADAVVALSNAAPGAVTGPLAARAKLDALLLANDAKTACPEVQKLVSGGATDLTKAQIFCSFATGNTLQGNLALDLLRERKDPDQAFIAAAETMSGLPPLPADKVKVTEITPVHVAAFAAAKMPLPAEAAAKAVPVVARAIAQSFATPADIRLVAAERAEAVGALAPEALRKTYLEQSFAPDELGNPLTRAETAGPRTRALLFRAATDQPDPALKAAFVAKALNLSKGQLASTARVFSAFLGEIKPEPILAGHAEIFAKANLALGRGPAAQVWLDILRAEPTNAKALERLWPLTVLAAAAPGQPVDAKALAAWRATLDGQPAEQVARKTALVLGSLAALGAKIPDAAWLDILSLPAGGPKPALFALMQGAALEARTGLTLLASLAALGDQGLDKVDTITLSETISALSVIGLTDDARKLAAEAFLANGI